MHLGSLKVFCDVVRYHNFSRAASVNAVSQSAASQSVLQLEKALAVRLIDRSKRPWALTPEGKFFFDGVKEIVDDYLALEEAVRRRSKAAGSKVRVAAIYSVGLQDMGQYVSQFQAVAPGVEVEIEYMHPARVYDSVLNDRADLGLISFAHNGQELSTIPWREEPMVFTCLAGHRLGRNKSIKPAELNGEKFVGFQRGLTIRREVDRFLKRHKVNLELVAEFDNIATIKQAVEEGTGVSILPEPTLRREVERQALAAVPFVGRPFVRPLSIIHRRKRVLSAAAVNFIDLLRGAAGAVPAGVGAGGPGANGAEEEASRSAREQARAARPRPAGKRPPRPARPTAPRRAVGRAAASANFEQVEQGAT